MISRDAWLSALSAAQNDRLSANDPTAITIAEFAAMLNVRRCTAAVKMKQLVDAGKAQPVTKLVKRGPGVYPAPAYRLIREDTP